MRACGTGEEALLTVFTDSHQEMVLRHHRHQPRPELARWHGSLEVCVPAFPESAPHPPQPLHILPCRLDDFHPAVRVINPRHQQVKDAMATPHSSRAPSGARSLARAERRAPPPIDQTSRGVGITGVPPRVRVPESRTATARSTRRTLRPAHPRNPPCPASATPRPTPRR